MFVFVYVYTLCLLSAVYIPFHSKCPLNTFPTLSVYITLLSTCTQLLISFKCIIYNITCLDKTKLRAEVYGMRSFVVCIKCSLHISLRDLLPYLFWRLLKSKKEINVIAFNFSKILITTYKKSWKIMVWIISYWFMIFDASEHYFSSYLSFCCMVIRHYDDPLYHDWKCDYPHERDHFVMDNGCRGYSYKIIQLPIWTVQFSYKLLFKNCAFDFFLEFQYYIWFNDVEFPELNILIYIPIYI